MAEDTSIRYFMSCFRDGKVTEMHILETEEQVKRISFTAQVKGCNVELHTIKGWDEPSTPGNGMDIKTITDVGETEWCKCVQCVETGEIFPSVRESSRKNGINYKSLYNAIKSGNPRKGLHFKPFNGEIPENVKVQRSDAFRRKKKNVYGRLVLCVTTGRMFKSVKEMLRAYPQVSSTSFYRSMKEGKPVEGLIFQYI